MKDIATEMESAKRIAKNPEEVKILGNHKVMFNFNITVNRRIKFIQALLFLFMFRYKHVQIKTD